MKIERYAREAKDWMEPDILRTQEFIYFVCKTSKFSPHSFKGTEAQLLKPEIVVLYPFAFKLNK